MSFRKQNSCFQSFKLGIPFSGRSRACKATSRIICPSPRLLQNVITSDHPIVLPHGVCLFVNYKRPFLLQNFNSSWSSPFPFEIHIKCYLSSPFTSLASLWNWVMAVACSCFKVRRDSKGSAIKTGGNFSKKTVLNSSQDWFVLKFATVETMTAHLLQEKPSLPL